MGHFGKLNPRARHIVFDGQVTVHIFNGGVRHRHTRLFKERVVRVGVFDEWPKRWPYSTVDGVLRRDPSTLSLWQRQQGTSRADARRARRQRKGLADVARSQAYRSREVGRGAGLGMDGR
jgi:hypothetical protein